MSVQKRKFDRAIHNERLKARSRELYSEYNGMVGSPMITADLRAEENFSGVMQLVFHKRFKDRIEAQQALFNYIEAYDNRRRRHSAKGYPSPAMFEMEWVKTRKMA